jgi:hypothetical protein
MHEIVTIAINELNKISATPTGNHLKTGDIRKLSAKVYSKVKSKPVDEIFAICEQLLEQHSWAFAF